jgi:hypothetical protein
MSHFDRLTTFSRTQLVAPTHSLPTSILSAIQRQIIMATAWHGMVKRLQATHAMLSTARWASLFVIAALFCALLATSWRASAFFAG